MRKRVYTSLSLHDAFAPPCDPARQPVPLIHNIVSTAQIETDGTPLDLEAIRRVLPGSSYDRARFAAMTIHLANPKCTLLLFSSGRLVVTGVKDWYEGVLSCLYVARVLRQCFPGKDFRLQDCFIQNIVANVELPMRESGMLDLEAMYTSLNLECTYQNDLFPGLIYRPPNSPIVLLCFYSGKIVIAGGRSTRDVIQGWNKLWPVVSVFVRDTGRASMASSEDIRIRGKRMRHGGPAAKKAGR